jgi:D-alanine-D-alanine ligase-like ATP-grasp enzyme
VKTLAIITGGKSPEHDVAIISSRNIFKAVDTTQYEIKVVGISNSRRICHYVFYRLMTIPFDCKMV